MPAPVSFLIPALDPTLTTLRERMAGADPRVPVAVWHVLSTISDPRGRRGCRHELATVLVVALCAVLSGARSLAAVADWATDSPRWCWPRLGVARSTPSLSTIRRVLLAVDADVLDAVLHAWLAALNPPQPTPASRKQLRAFAVDGKTARGARQPDGSRTHLFSMVEHTTGVPHGQVLAPTRGAEIAAFSALLDRIDLHDVVRLRRVLHLVHRGGAGRQHRRRPHGRRWSGRRRACRRRRPRVGRPSLRHRRGRARPRDGRGQQRRRHRPDRTVHLDQRRGHAAGAGRQRARVLVIAREAVRRWDARASPGALVTVSSIAATLGAPHEYVPYAASKAAVEAMTVGLAKEVAARGIRVNAVAPGTVHTGIHAAAGEPDRPARVVSRVPMGRIGEPDEIASAVVWLLSDEASYVTGAVLRVSGGV